MAKERWIVVPNWHGPTGFQHYKDRDPKWIKVYRRLHSDDDYLRLSGHCRAVLLGVWLEYASSHCQLRLDTGSLSRRLGLRVTMAHMKALNQAGFVLFSASRPLAEPEHSGTDRLPRLEEIRKEKMLPLNGVASSTSKAKTVANATKNDLEPASFAARAAIAQAKRRMEGEAS